MAKNIVKNNNEIPLVSVVMSVYNGEKYLREAVDSILNQTFKDFEFIIINDGSTDNTLKILKTYKDPRIVLVSRKNKGLVESLNEGIKKAKGKYIARQDADDISSKDRLSKEIAAMKKYNNVVILGSSMRVIDMKGKIMHTHHVLINNEELKSELLVRSPFAHGSVIFSRKDALDAGLYRKEYWPAEDYEFWLRISKYGKLMNIYEPLYLYRENTSGISAVNSNKQQVKKFKVKNNASRCIDRLINKKPNIVKYYKLKDNFQVVNRILENYKEIIANNKELLNIKQRIICKNMIFEAKAFLFIIKIKKRIIK